MSNMWNQGKGPFQMLFGDNASADPNVVLPIAMTVVIVLFAVAVIIILRSKGKSEMTEEELERDRASFDLRMSKQAKYVGEDYVPERARVQEAKEIAAARGEDNDEGQRDAN